MPHLAPPPMTPIAITAFTATTALGAGVDALGDALRTRRSGLRAVDFDGGTGATLPTWIGRVDAVDVIALPASWRGGDSRNHRLAWLALQQDGFVDAARDAVARHGAARVAVLIGTSTSTIAESERLYREHAASDVATFDDGDTDRPPMHHLHATTAFVRDVLGATGPCATVSTACSSSAKVFAQAARMIAAGIVDAAVVGGVDSLAASTIFGFHALGLVSQAPCRPFDSRRDGISIGEAGGFALLERARADERRFDVAGSLGAPGVEIVAKSTTSPDGPWLIGYGESSDAHHLSSPDPEGLGARRAIDAALQRAGVAVEAVDYLNLHGTATPKNDAVEAAVVASMFPPSLHAHSTKGWTGHTLGAAGIVEAVIALIAMRDGFAAGQLDDASPGWGPQIRFAAESRPIGIALSNAFAFGGSNCVLAFARDRASLAAARTLA